MSKNTIGKVKNNLTILCIYVQKHSIVLKWKNLFITIQKYYYYYTQIKTQSNKYESQKAFENQQNDTNIENVDIGTKNSLKYTLRKSQDLCLDLIRLKIEKIKIFQHAVYDFALFTFQVSQWEISMWRMVKRNWLPLWEKVLFASIVLSALFGCNQLTPDNNPLSHSLFLSLRETQKRASITMQIALCVSMCNFKVVAPFECLN